MRLLLLICASKCGHVEKGILHRDCLVHGEAVLVTGKSHHLLSSRLDPRRTAAVVGPSCHMRVTSGNKIGDGRW